MTGRKFLDAARQPGTATRLFIPGPGGWEQPRCHQQVSQGANWATSPKPTRLTQTVVPHFCSETRTAPQASFVWYGTLLQTWYQRSNEYSYFFCYVSVWYYSVWFRMLIIHVSLVVPPPECPHSHSLFVNPASPSPSGTNSLHADPTTGISG